MRSACLDPRPPGHRCSSTRSVGTPACSRCCCRIAAMRAQARTPEGPPTDTWKTSVASVVASCISVGVCDTQSQWGFGCAVGPTLPFTDCHMVQESRREASIQDASLWAHDRACARTTASQPGSRSQLHAIPKVIAPPSPRVWCTIVTRARGNTGGMLASGPSRKHTQRHRH